MSRRSLVTGAAGFIGSHLVRALLARGDTVVGVDDLSTGRRRNLPVSDNFELIVGDVTDEDLMLDAVREMNVVFHLAAVPSVPRSMKDPLKAFRANALGTAVVLEASRRAGVRRVVYASSSSIYGGGDTLPKVETMPPTPRSPYAASKLAGEVVCQTYHRAYGLETVILRYFNVFGPRQDPSSAYAAVVAKLAEAVLHDRPMPIHGDGEQSRDFTYVDNVVAANLAAAEAPHAPGEIINVAAGGRTSVCGLVELAEEIIGKPIVRQRRPARPGDVRHSQADIEKAARLLGYRVMVSLREGLRRLLLGDDPPRSSPRESDDGLGETAS